MLCLSVTLYVGQVPLTSTEAQALKESRQASASQDWLMGTEPTYSHDRPSPGTGATPVFT